MVRLYRRLRVPVHRLRLSAVRRRGRLLQPAPQRSGLRVARLRRLFPKRH